MRCATHLDEDVRVYIARSVCVIAITPSDGSEMVKVLLLWQWVLLAQRAAVKLLCLLNLLPRRFPVVHLVHHETIPPNTYITVHRWFNL